MGMDMDVVYFISSGNRTYIGVTNCLRRRVRQHNGEIRGGAAATRGRAWRLHMYIAGFANRRAALSCEWHLKHSWRRAGCTVPPRGVVERGAYFLRFAAHETWQRHCPRQRTRWWCGGVHTVLVVGNADS